MYVRRPWTCCEFSPFRQSSICGLLRNAIHEYRKQLRFIWNAIAVQRRPFILCRIHLTNFTNFDRDNIIIILLYIVRWKPAYIAQHVNNIVRLLNTIVIHKIRVFFASRFGSTSTLLYCITLIIIILLCTG